MVNGKKVYNRIFIRLRTPEEVLTFKPIQDGADFARRAACIEQWYNRHIADGNVMLLFEASEISEEDAQSIMNETDNQ